MHSLDLGIGKKIDGGYFFQGQEIGQVKICGIPSVERTFCKAAIRALYLEIERPGHHFECPIRPIPRPHSPNPLVIGQRPGRQP